jgi:3-oxocholest-4-en-26-oyl-CoA dehydrogenase beta subunit
MDFGLDEMQKMLQLSAREFLNIEYPEKLLRQMSKDKRGFTQELWSKITESGWTALSIPEEYGGLGSYLDLIVVLQEMGRVLLISPYFSTMVLGASILIETGTEEQKKEYLSGISSGKLILTLALLEASARYTADAIKIETCREDNYFIIQGVKLFVPHADAADCLIVPVRTNQSTDPEDGISLFIIDRHTQGISCELMPTIDGDKQYQVFFNNVRVDRVNMLGEEGQGWKYIQKVMPRAIVAKCAETIGACEKVMEISLNYVKERTAFGHPIGSFQSIQHRCADMLIDLEGSRLVTYKAGWLISSNADAFKEASLAKAWLNQCARRIAASAHQVHGAIGFTEDHILHLYTKRVRSNEFSFGDQEYHLNKITENVI